MSALVVKRRQRPWLAKLDRHRRASSSSLVAGVGGYLAVAPRDRRRPSSASCARPRSASRPRSAASSRRSRSRRAHHVHAGDVVAELSALELTASVGAGARRARRRDCRPQQRLCRRAREQVASLQAEIAKAKSRLDYAQAQLTPHHYAGAQRRRLAAGARPGRKTTWRARVPTSPKRRRTMTPRSPDRPKRSAPSPTRRCRPRPPRSRCSSGGSTRPSCGRRPTASSA